MAAENKTDGSRRAGICDTISGTGIYGVGECSVTENLCRCGHFKGRKAGESRSPEIDKVVKISATMLGVFSFVIYITGSDYPFESTDGYQKALE